MKPFEPRPVSRIADTVHMGWAIKRYRISYAPTVQWPAHFEEAVTTALAVLPAPAVTTARAGVGFIIEHRGDGVDYLVLAWWDRENELPLRVWVNAADSGIWRSGSGSESVCVWDLEVIWRERESYVATLMANGADARLEYLAR